MKLLKVRNQKHKIIKILNIKSLFTKNQLRNIVLSVEKFQVKELGQCWLKDSSNS